MNDIDTDNAETIAKWRERLQSEDEPDQSSWVDGIEGLCARLERAQAEIDRLRPLADQAVTWQFLHSPSPETFDFPIVKFNTLGKFKTSNGEIRDIDLSNFHMTGIPPNFENALEQAKKYGSSSLETIGYFYDENGYLRDSSDIKQYLNI